jgi:hypothetical protein
VVVGGNHDITLHEAYYEEAGEERFHKNRPDGPYFPPEMQRMLRNLEGEFGVRYLDNEAVEVMGLTFWGTPWTPEYGGESDACLTGVKFTGLDGWAPSPPLIQCGAGLCGAVRGCRVGRGKRERGGQEHGRTDGRTG